MADYHEEGCLPTMPLYSVLMRVLRVKLYSDQQTLLRPEVSTLSRYLLVTIHPWSRVMVTSGILATVLLLARAHTRRNVTITLPRVTFMSSRLVRLFGQLKCNDLILGMKK